jgi:hypothetical protein
MKRFALVPLCLMSLPTFAQQSVTTTTTVLPSVWVNLLPFLVSGALAALVWLLFTLSQKAMADTHATKLVQVAGRFAHFAAVVVQDLNARMKPALQAATSDGQLTAAEMKQLKDEAMKQLKALAGENGLTELRDTLKIAAPDIEGYLSGLIETKVAESKTIAVVAKPLAAAATAARPF